MAEFMLLPSKDCSRMRLLRLPPDYEGQEAFRHVTGLIAGVECQQPDCAWDDIAEALEGQGYELVEFLLGPSLD
jgi:hypothetical protein